MLGGLADRFPEVREAIRTLAHDPNAHVRINALVALHSVSISPLHAEIFTAGLRDRSTRARALATDKSMTDDLVRGM